MKYVLFLAGFAITTQLCFSQKIDDRKIIVTFSDTANKWLQAKHAFIREGFMVVDIPGDTAATYPRTFVNVGLVMANGIISGNTITLSGYYGFKQANLSGIDIMRKAPPKTVRFKSRQIL